MKRYLLFLSIIMVGFSLVAAKIYREDGSFFQVSLNPQVKAQKLSPVQFRNSAPLQTLVTYKIRNNYFVITTDGIGTLPVYNRGQQFFIADNVIFWRGNDADADRIARKYDMELREILPAYNLYKFSVSGDSIRIAQNITENGDGFAYPNIVRRIQLRETPVSIPPEDQYYTEGYQWFLKNTGTSIDPYKKNIDTLENADIRFEDAMEWIVEQIDAGTLTNFDETTKVAIMDSGVDLDHPDLKNKLDEGWDVVNDQPGGENDEPEDGSIMGVGGYAHGTNCAGVAAAEGNTIGTAGVCPWCGIYPVHYMSGGVGGGADEEGLLKVYNKYVDDPQITAINCSFGSMSMGQTVAISQAQIDSHTNFMKNGRDGKGGVIVYAAGNDAVNSSYEELHSYEFQITRDEETYTNTVFTVAASSAWDTRVAYSNFGEDIDIAAPSLSLSPMIGITTPTIMTYGDLDEDYSTQFSGTSAAAPVITGAFGVLFSVNPDLTLEEATDIMISTADRINPDTGLWDENNHSIKYGYGRLNLLRAVKVAAGDAEAVADMCESAVDETDNNIDDNCDRFVDETFSPDISNVAQPCTEDAECVNNDFIEDNVECLTESYGVYGLANGYCTITNNNFTCPDGTLTAKPEQGESNCFLECSADDDCPGGQLCTGDELGFCVPSCETDGDCGEEAICEDSMCGRIPSEPFGECDEDDDCKYGGMCYTQVPDGVCVVMCQSDSQCGDEGAKCVTIEMQGQSLPVCVPPCEQDSDCRNIGGMMQLKCHELFSTKENVCGMPCEADADCKDNEAVCDNGTCIAGGETNDDDEIADDEITDDDGTVDDTGEIGDIDVVEDNGGSSDSKKSSGCSVTLL